MNDIVKQRFIEAETKAYKSFMPIAKRIKKIEYDKKWEIIPDPSDPLRKFTLERETEWFRIKFILLSHEFYHRNIWDDTRYDWRFYVGYTGVYKRIDEINSSKRITSVQIKPRMLKKLLKIINEAILPNIYNDIEKENSIHNESIKIEKEFKTNLELLGIKDSKIKSNDYQRDINSLLATNPKIRVTANHDSVFITGDMSYERFAKIARACGWIK